MRFFFFQAEDGIRDYKVTGVQTCALPICHVQGFAGALQVEMFKGGQSNPTYKLVTPGRSYVIRSKPGPVAKLLPSAHAIGRAFRGMKVLPGTDVPVPHMYALCEDESIIDRK